MKKPNMVWVRRFFITVLFIIAATLTVLMNTVDRVHLQRVEAYGFLFAIPWAWLLDRGWFEDVHSRWGEALMAYAVLLWVPALLYSGCLWLLLRGLDFVAHRNSNLDNC
jgi:hypothetical protein